MKNTFLLMTIIVAASAKNVFSFREEIASHPKNYGFDSKQKSEDGEKDDNNRYEVYGGDESSSFADAVEINKDVEYDFMHNTRHDIDYIKCNINAGDVITINCDIYTDIDIFKKVGTSYILYFNESINNSFKIVFDSNSTFYFKVTGPSAYTGPYTFKLTTQTVDVTSMDLNYVQLKFNSTNICSSKLITFSDFANLPTTGYKNGFCGSNNNTQFDLNYYNGSLLLNYATSHDISYILDYHGIFDSNNIATGYDTDDERKRYFYTDYLYDSTPYMVSSFTTTSPYSRRATSFFVDDNIAFSAAHMIYNSENLNECFANNVYLTTSKYPFNVLNEHNIPCVELYFPYGYIYHNLNNSPIDLCRYYDWCIMKVDTSVLPSSYIHSYLGVSYPADLNLTYYNVGYPGYRYVVENGGSMNDIYFDKYSILAGSCGAIYSQNSLSKTYMDITNGPSRGLCLYKDNNNLGVAVGIVSGNNNDGNGNIFSTINKYNYAILSKYLSGVI